MPDFTDEERKLSQRLWWDAETMLENLMMKWDDTIENHGQNVSKQRVAELIRHNIGSDFEDTWLEWVSESG